MHYKVIKYLTQSMTKKPKMYIIKYSALLQRKDAVYTYAAICHFYIPKKASAMLQTRRNLVKGLFCPCFRNGRNCISYTANNSFLTT